MVQPVDAPHQVFPAVSDVRDASGNAPVTAYALLRPDGSWSLLLINKDRQQEHAVRIMFRSAGWTDAYFSGPVDVITFGSDQYQWHTDGPNGYADPSGPPLKLTVTGDERTAYNLPKASITVIRGTLRLI